jgi:hypothetical protein
MAKTRRMIEWDDVDLGRPDRLESPEASPIVGKQGQLGAAAAKAAMAEMGRRETNRPAAKSRAPVSGAEMVPAGAIPARSTDHESPAAV